MASFSDIFSNTAAGAGTGAAIGSIFPGPGTAIGAAIGGAGGLLSGIFGGGDKKRKRADQRVSAAQANIDQELERTRALHNVLQGRLDTLTNTPITRSATFQAGRGALHNLLLDRSQADASAAAARGLTGGEFEIAQAGNRQQTAGEVLRNLLGQAEAAQRAERANVLAQLLNTQGLAHNLVGTQADLASGQQSRLDAQRAANQQAVANAVMQALLATQGSPHNTN